MCDRQYVDRRSALSSAASRQSSDARVVSLWRATVAAIGATLSAPVIWAAENTLEYEIEAGYEYNDNVRLLPDDQEIAISGGKVAIPVTYTSRTERFTGEVKGTVEFSQFDESEYDSDDQRLEAKANYALERGSVEGYALINRDTTRDSEFLDTGIVGLSATRREMIEAGGALEHALTERNGLVIEGQVSDVTYESPRFEDYLYGTTDIGWAFQSSERMQWQLQLHGTSFESDGPRGTESTGVGAKVGFSNQVSERLQFSVYAGMLSIDSDYDPLFADALSDDTEDTHLVDAKLRYKGERSTFNATWVSAPLPSANGFLQTTDQLTLRYRYALSERTSSIINAVAGRRGILDERINSDRDYARIGLTLEHAISQSWFVAARYIYSRQDREQVPGTAGANEFHFSLVFRPRASVWSG